MPGSVVTGDGSSTLEPCCYMTSGASDAVDRDGRDRDNVLEERWIRSDVCIGTGVYEKASEVVLRVETEKAEYVMNSSSSFLLNAALAAVFLGLLFDLSELSESETNALYRLTISLSDNEDE